MERARRPEDTPIPLIYEQLLATQEHLGKSLARLEAIALAASRIGLEPWIGEPLRIQQSSDDPRGLVERYPCPLPGPGNVLAGFRVSGLPVGARAVYFKNSGAPQGERTALDLTSAGRWLLPSPWASTNDGPSAAGEVHVQWTSQSTDVPRFIQPIWWLESLPVPDSWLADAGQVVSHQGVSNVRSTVSFWSVVGQSSDALRLSIGDLPDSYLSPTGRFAQLNPPPGAGACLLWNPPATTGTKVVRLSAEHPQAPSIYGLVGWLELERAGTDLEFALPKRSLAEFRLAGPAESITVESPDANFTLAVVAWVDSPSNEFAWLRARLQQGNL
jgi:hypothetical protein